MPTFFLPAYIFIDISPLLEKWDDPNLIQDEGVADVVKKLDQACREAGFFYVVIFYHCFLNL